MHNRVQATLVHSYSPYLGFKKVVLDNCSGATFCFGLAATTQAFEMLVLNGQDDVFCTTVLQTGGLSHQTPQRTRHLIIVDKYLKGSVLRVQKGIKLNFYPFLALLIRKLRRSLRLLEYGAGDGNIQSILLNLCAHIATQNHRPFSREVVKKRVNSGHAGHRTTSTNHGPPHEIVLFTHPQRCSLSRVAKQGLQLSAPF